MTCGDACSARLAFPFVVVPWFLALIPVNSEVHVPTRTSALKLVQSAELSGVVRSSSGSAPVAAAIVTAKGKLTNTTRAGITDDDGRFRIAELPPDRYTLTATKPPFLPTAYGTWRPNQPGIEIAVLEGQSVSALTIMMVRGAAIGGSVRDESGRAVPNAQIAVSRLGPRPPAPKSTISDHEGRYRISGLAPGEYVVSAMPTVLIQTLAASMDARDVDSTLASLRRAQVAGALQEALDRLPRPKAFNLMPVFYPGALTPGDATPLLLAPGDEQTGIDIVLRVGPTSSIAGAVAGMQESERVELTLNQRGAQNAAPLSRGKTQVLAGEYGSFRFDSVNPGSYIIEAHAVRPLQRDITSPRTEQASWARTEVTVNGEDVRGISLTLQPALHLVGKVVSAAGAMLPSALGSGWRVTAEETLGLGSSRLNDVGLLAQVVPTLSAPVRADGTFDLAGLEPGLFSLRLSGLPDGWRLKSALLGGTDLLDTQLGVSGAPLDSVTLTITDRHTELSGKIYGPATGAASQYFVVVFPVDRSLWRVGSRRIRATRAATDGTYQIPDLPGGTYFVVALSDFAADDLDDLALVASLSENARQFDVSDVIDTKQDLRIGDQPGVRPPDFSGKWTPRDPSTADKLFDVGLSEIPGSGTLTISQTDTLITFAWDMPEPSRKIRDTLRRPTATTFPIVPSPGDVGTASWKGQALVIQVPLASGAPPTRTEIFTLTITAGVLQFDQTIQTIASGRSSTVRQFYLRGQPFLAPAFAAKPRSSPQGRICSDLMATTHL